MARKFFFSSLVAIIGSSLLFGFLNLGPAAAQAFTAPEALAEATRQRILRATVQITMVRDEVVETELGITDAGTALVSRQRFSTVAHGIGTLVAFGQDVVLVTHNHWPQVSGSVRPDRVQFFDPQGNQLLEMDGSEFQQAIRYRDGGTLVIDAPEALVGQMTPVSTVATAQALTAGAVVYVVRRQPQAPTTLGFVAARVTSVETDGAHTLLMLQTAAGQSIEPGDSGGGIWVDGQLVGNMWMTIREEHSPNSNPAATRTVVTDRSRAAGLTDGLLDALSATLQAVEQVTALSAERAPE